MMWVSASITGMSSISDGLNLASLPGGAPQRERALG
jgi:hypothetical protein